MLSLRSLQIQVLCGFSSSPLVGSVEDGLGYQALAARGAPVVAHHLGGDRRLIDEDETRRIQRRLLGFQLGACGGDIRTILLGGVQSFF